MTTRQLGWGLNCEFCKLFISNRIVPNRFVDVDCLSSRRCCLAKALYSFDVRWFSNTVSGVNVTWRRIRARSGPESLISESDLELLISSEETLYSPMTKRCCCSQNWCYWRRTRHSRAERCSALPASMDEFDFATSRITYLCPICDPPGYPRPTGIRRRSPRPE